MSWSVNLIGTPEGISKKLDAIGDQMQAGQSKLEFLEVKPYLQGLLGQVLGETVKLNAAGHANFNSSPEGKQVKTFGHVSVTLEAIFGEFCQ